MLQLNFLRVLSAILSIFTLIALTPSAEANSPNDIPEDIFMPDFSYAGYGFGVGDIPESFPTLINAEEFGVIADDEKDDSAALISAFNAASSVEGGVVIQLPKGKILLSEIIPISRSNIILRGYGNGTNGTEVHFPRPLSMIETGQKFDEIREYLKKYDKFQKEPDKNIHLLFSEYSWTGGLFWIGPENHRGAPYLIENDEADNVLAIGISGRRGERNLSVSTTKSVKKGDIVQLVWYNREGQNGPLISELYGPTDSKVGSHHWTFPDRGLIRQKTQISEIKGNIVTLGDPLLHNVSDNIPAEIVTWSPITNVGIEDIHISFPKGVSFGHHLEQGYNAIYFNGVFNGWARNITIDEADSGILSYDSGNLTFANITTTGERTAHYAVHAGNVHNILITELDIHNPVRHSLSVNTQSTRTVFHRAEIWQYPVLDQHAGANHQNLFDTIKVHATPNKDKNGNWSYPLWDGSGAGYWQPGHGRYNTSWNIQVEFSGGASRTESVSLLGLAEGPDARLIGITANRSINIDYRPKPYMGATNTLPQPLSLYEFQLRQRAK